MKLESKFKNLVETSEIKKDGLQKPSYANIAVIDINKTRDSGLELEVVENETEETETRKSHNIIIHGVEELMNADQKRIRKRRSQIC